MMLRYENFMLKIKYTKEVWEASRSSLVVIAWCYFSDYSYGRSGDSFVLLCVTLPPKPMFANDKPSVKAQRSS